MISTPTCAEDTALLANSVGQLQAMLNIVEFNTKRDLVKIILKNLKYLTLSVKRK